jgi:hypothetical protein
MKRDTFAPPFDSYPSSGLVFENATEAAKSIDEELQYQMINDNLRYASRVNQDIKNNSLKDEKTCYCTICGKIHTPQCKPKRSGIKPGPAINFYKVANNHSDNPTINKMALNINASIANFYKWPLMLLITTNIQNIVRKKIIDGIPERLKNTNIKP